MHGPRQGGPRCLQCHTPPGAGRRSPCPGQPAPGSALPCTESEPNEVFLRRGVGWGKQHGREVFKAAFSCTGYFPGGTVKIKEILRPEMTLPLHRPAPVRSCWGMRWVWEVQAGGGGGMCPREWRGRFRSLCTGEHLTRRGRKRGEGNSRAPVSGQGCGMGQGRGMGLGRGMRQGRGMRLGRGIGLGLGMGQGPGMRLGQGMRLGCGMRLGRGGLPQRCCPQTCLHTQPRFRVRVTEVSPEGLLAELKSPAVAVRRRTPCSLSWWLRTCLFCVDTEECVPFTGAEYAGCDTVFYPLSGVLFGGRNPSSVAQAVSGLFLFCAGPWGPGGHDLLRDPSGRVLHFWPAPPPPDLDVLEARGTVLAGHLSVGLSSA